MDEKKPKISILFPVLNGVDFIRQTLDTVVSQTYPDWELIAMDGESNDGTLEILHEYSDKHPNIRVFSSPDETGFHAITKAGERARGEFIVMLAVSDGYLDNEWLAKCMKVMESDPEISLVWGIPFQMSEGGKLLGPNYVYAHFLEKEGDFKRSNVLKDIIRKIDLRKPSSIFEFLRKITPANRASVHHMLKSEAPPQKQDWFRYWLKTGTIFPDGNMFMSRKVFFEYFPSYRVGTHESGDFGVFNFDFNAKGYLAYCIPEPANFGRTHSGQVGEKVKAYNDEVQKNYLKRVGEFRKDLVSSGKKFVFLDRAGKPINKNPV